jgi:3-hydroxyacyl-CoA dehydrogenase
VADLARKLGKTPIGVKNSAGFVVNRILCPMINEAVFTLQEGLASAEEIDAGMRLGCNHPIGPLALCDLVGLDVQLAVMEVLYSNLQRPEVPPGDAAAGNGRCRPLGRKSGRGFTATRSDAQRGARHGRWSAPMAPTPEFWQERSRPGRRPGIGAWCTRQLQQWFDAGRACAPACGSWCRVAAPDTKSSPWRGSASR